MPGLTISITGTTCMFGILRLSFACKLACPNPSFSSNSCDGSGAICPENCEECKTETPLGVTKIGPSKGDSTVL